MCAQMPSEAREGVGFSDGEFQALVSLRAWVLGTEFESCPDEVAQLYTFAYSFSDLGHILKPSF